jgi:hypothetical protein
MADVFQTPLHRKCSLWQVDVFQIQDDAASVWAQALALVGRDRLPTHLLIKHQATTSSNRASG